MKSAKSVMTEAFNIKVKRIKENEDGSTNLTFNMTPHFQEWFCFFQGIEEWDQKIFEEWVLKTLEEYLERENETSNDN